MPEQCPNSRIISMSYVTRSYNRFASYSLPIDSKNATCLGAALCSSLPLLCPKLDPSGLVEAEPVAEGRGGGKTESGGIAGIGNEQFSGYSESGDGQVVDGF